MTEDNLTNEIETDATEIENVEDLTQALVDEKQKAEGYMANWQRAQADFINYKRRSEQEKEEISRYANSTLILNLLPILDDFERAINAVPLDIDEPGWLEGVKLIERKMLASLEAQGLSPIKAVGEPFDPNFHEAVRQDKGKDGIIVEEIQKGYRFHDRVIRPSRVVVGNGESEEITKNEPENNNH